MLSSHSLVAPRIAPTSPQSEVICLEDSSESDDETSDGNNCIQIDESSEDESNNASSDEDSEGNSGIEENNDDITTTELDLDSESGLREEDSNQDVASSNNTASVDQEEDNLITDLSELDDMTTLPMILETFRHGIMQLRKGKTVELKDGDFLRIRKIHLVDTTGFDGVDICLQGLRLRRTRDIDGLVTKHTNELCWVEESFQDGFAYDEDVPLQEVCCIRQLRMTNKSWAAFSVKHTMNWPPKSKLYRNEGILFCRIKYEVDYKNRAQKAKDNSFSFVEKCVRNLTIEETDGEYWEDPADIRAKYRGEETPTMRRLRRSVSTMTLLGDHHMQDADNDVQEIPNPATPEKLYTFGDVFCGGGGMSCGAQMAGLVVRWGVDFNMDAMRTYQLNFNHASCECASIEQFLNPSIYPPAQYRVHVLHLSPPCQSFSPAQVHKPEDFEDKQVVILAVNDLVKMVKPRVVTMEETFGLLHEMNRDFFKSVVISLTDQGYSVRWKIMNFIEYGVPQPRRRVVLIAAAPGETLPPFPAPTHLNNPTTIASEIRNIPANAPNHHPKIYAVPKRPYSANGPLTSLIATAGGLNNFHPTGFRPFTVREFACLQTFPRDFVFVGSRTAIVKQIGNAVPPLPGKTIYQEIIRTLRETDEADR